MILLNKIGALNLIRSFKIYRDFGAKCRVWINNTIIMSELPIGSRSSKRNEDLAY
jgi:hypothetical protein